MDPEGLGDIVQTARISYNRSLLEPVVAVVIPTLAADAVLGECLRSLEAQTFRDFEVIVVDNSGQGRARRIAGEFACRILENERNAGFGAAVNQGFEASRARFVATLNDDAVAHRGWLGALVVVSAILSTLLHMLYFGRWAILPIVIDGIPLFWWLV